MKAAWMNHSQSITVDLGEQQELLDRRLQSGAYGSASEVLKAALVALDRQDDAAMRAKIEEALDDPAPDLPAETVFADLRAHHRASVKAAKRAR